MYLGIIYPGRQYRDCPGISCSRVTRVSNDYVPRRAEAPFPRATVHSGCTRQSLHHIIHLCVPGHMNPPGKCNMPNHGGHDQVQTILPWHGNRGRVGTRGGYPVARMALHPVHVPGAPEPSPPRSLPTTGPALHSTGGGASRTRVASALWTIRSRVPLQSR